MVNNERVQKHMSKKGENIYKRKDGRWEGRYKCGFTNTGKVKYKSVYSKSYKECKEKLMQEKYQYEAGKSYSKVCMTVKELLFVWLSSIVVNIKKSTYDAYFAIIKNHIEPYMGDIHIDAISPEYIDSFINTKLQNGRLDNKGGLSAKTVQNIVGVIKSAFKYAERTYGIRNPAQYVNAPKAEYKEANVMTFNEISRIRQYFALKQDYFMYAFELCLGTGIRIGELCALQCCDLDFDNETLTISKTSQRVKNDDPTSECRTNVIITSPKTKNSTRKIPVPKELSEKFKTFIDGKEKGDYIFSADGKNPLDVRTIQKRFALILKKCGIRHLNFHTIRHTFATKWVNSNFDIKSLSEILGHASVKITLSLYVHSSMEIKREQINKLFAA